MVSRNGLLVAFVSLSCVSAGQNRIYIDAGNHEAWTCDNSPLDWIIGSPETEATIGFFRVIEERALEVLSVDEQSKLKSLEHIRARAEFLRAALVGKVWPRTIDARDPLRFPIITARETAPLGDYRVQSGRIYEGDSVKISLLLRVDALDFYDGSEITVDGGTISIMPFVRTQLVDNDTCVLLGSEWRVAECLIAGLAVGSYKILAKSSKWLDDSPETELFLANEIRVIKRP